MDFYLYLPSNTGDFIDNSINKFRVKLPHLIDLDGEWEVALVEIGYPITWFNIDSEKDAEIEVMFKGEIEYTTKPIPFNNYSSIDELCDAINYTLDEMVSKENEAVSIKFYYDKFIHRVCIKPNFSGFKPNLHFIRLSQHLQYMLGFKSPVLMPFDGLIEVKFKNDDITQIHIVPSEGIVWTSYDFADNIIYFLNILNQKNMSFINAADIPDLRVGLYSLYVYCNIVEPQIIGNAMAPILRAVNIRGNFGDIIDEVYNNPHYVPVLKKEFNIIEINISDDTGKLVNFQYGKVFVKLHFRMKI